MIKITLNECEVKYFLLYRYRYSLVSIVGIFWLPSILRSFKDTCILEISKISLLVIVYIFSQIHALAQVPVNWYIFFFTLAPALTLLVSNGKINTKLNTKFMVFS